MSFVITVYVPTGIVMASDSRQSITIEGKTPGGKPLPKVETVSSGFVYKTFLSEKLARSWTSLNKPKMHLLASERIYKRSV